MGLPFWWAPVGLLTILGETLCWSHIVLQSELLGWLEDSTWTLLQIVVLLTGKTRHLQYIILGPLVTHMLLLHLPRMAKRIKPPYVE